MLKYTRKASFARRGESMTFYRPYMPSQNRDRRHIATSSSSLVGEASSFVGKQSKGKESALSLKLKRVFLSVDIKFFDDFLQVQSVLEVLISDLCLPCSLFLFLPLYVFLLSSLPPSLPRESQRFCAVNFIAVVGSQVNPTTI
jgi:hypothetical protein